MNLLRILVISSLFASVSFAGAAEGSSCCATKQKTDATCPVSGKTDKKVAEKCDEAAAKCEKPAEACEKVAKKCDSADAECKKACEEKAKTAKSAVKADGCCAAEAAAEAKAS